MQTYLPFQPERCFRKTPNIKGLIRCFRAYFAFKIRGYIHHNEYDKPQSCNVADAFDRDLRNFSLPSHIYEIQKILKFILDLYKLIRAI